MVEHKLHVRTWSFCNDSLVPKCSYLNTHLHIFLNGLQNFHVKLLYRNNRKVHVAEQAVDDLEEGLLHAREALLQQLCGEAQPESV